MSPVHLRNLGIPRNHPEDREGFSRTRRPGGGHLGHSGGWQDIEGNHTNSAIHFPIKQKSQTRGLEGYGSSSSAPPTPQRSFPMEHGQELQPCIQLGRTWSKLEPHQQVQTPGGEGNWDKGESSHYPSYRRTAEPDRAYSDSFRLTRSRPNQLSSGFTSSRNQRISGQESLFFTIPGSFQENTRIQGQKQDLFQQKAERVRPSNPEAVGLGESSMQEPEIVLHTFRITSPINRNITPTQTEHNVVKPESNLNSDKLWLQMSQFAVQTQEQLDYFKRLNEGLQRNAILKEATIKDIQESCDKLRKAAEEANKRLVKSLKSKTTEKGTGIVWIRTYRNCLMSTKTEIPNHKAMLWMILTTKKASNQMPYWGIRQDLHLNTNIEITCLILRRKP
ncbi:hypothetical protein O181_021990 [Austropuccinia psidii MF-1]|uniref:Uncharacterized protein n=1 Tax=Austropuccinia psidii MF-1 TaxID=1389203 RepID=A0A9Q3GXM6_9BASI|nr:hypothetical protein [Austropuccinia psidii MF-1]